MYFADYSSATIKRARLDGSQVVDFVTITEERSQANALWRVPDQDMLYWTQSGAQVKRTSLLGDGSEVEALSTYDSGQFSVDRVSIAVDESKNQVYYADLKEWRINRKTWSLASDDEQTFVDDMDTIYYPQAIAIDPTTRMLYWIDSGTDDVRRLSLDGDGSGFRCPWARGNHGRQRCGQVVLH